MIAHDNNPITLEMEAGGFLWVETSLDFKGGLVFKKKKDENVVVGLVACMYLLFFILKELSPSSLWRTLHSKMLRSFYSNYRPLGQEECFSRL